MQCIYWCSLLPKSPLDPLFHKNIPRPPLRGDLWKPTRYTRRLTLPNKNSWLRPWQMWCNHHPWLQDSNWCNGERTRWNVEHNPEYKPVDPVIYPLFKLHKFSSEHIREKLVPPARFLNNTKNSPLYRLNKWLSPYLTDISRQHCKDEFIKDADEFLACINASNLEQAAIRIPKTRRQNFLSFCLKRWDFYFVHGRCYGNQFQGSKSNGSQVISIWRSKTSFWDNHAYC